MPQFIEAVARWTQQECYKWVACYQDQYRPGEPGYGEVGDFLWCYDPAFPLDRLEGGRESWKTWWQEELRDLALDGECKRYDDNRPPATRKSEPLSQDIRYA